MNIGIAVVLVKSFIEKNYEHLELKGYSAQIFEEVKYLANEFKEDEIVDCLMFINKVGMVKNCFPDNINPEQKFKDDPDSPEYRGAK